MSKLKLGINEEMSNEEYHGDKIFLSSSALKLILRDENEFYRKYILREKDESKSFFDFGTYIHALILEPWTVEDEFAFFGGVRRFGKTYDEFCIKNAGKIVMTLGERKLADKIMESYKSNDLATSMVSNGVPEETYAAILEGMKVKARADYIASNYILDVKTTSSSLTSSAIQSTIMKYDYDLSAALYLDVANAAGKNLEEFIFLFVNKKSCDILICKASPELIENGRRKYKAAIAKWKELEALGFFDPDKKQEEIVTVNLPDWGVFR